MKLNRTYLFISISSLALVIVLIIQVNWIVQTAQIKEELFNEKANMVLARTVEALASDKEACRKLETSIGKSEIHKIDSLFTHYMKFYNFHIEYYFEVKPGTVTFKDNIGFVNNLYPDDLYSKGLYAKPDQPGCYKKNLEAVANKNGVELKLIFPKKEQFIRQEMGSVFITSVILILVVLVLSWRTIVSLINEKKISEHTTDFLNNMTHEFKTPLTNIALAGKMILKASTHKQEERMKHHSEIILEENEKLRLQVEQMLSMTALERGEIPLQKTELDVHQLIMGALKYINIQVEDQNGYLKTDLVADRSVVMGDKTHLTNTLCNLIDNAIKYSGEKPELSVQTSNRGQHILIAVSDKGIGIEKKYHKKIFDKFFRVPTGDIHTVKGFGLGLAYIKKIVELHKGIIALESEKGKGTTFIIILPYV
ncbi:HAMP domain-containing sensor histidine kinase [Cytophagaceae bacterium DM2B3-1]|uniref:histidine kinase n=1 Tax=Xanthocytophaga flava TaxID=3048013 RepID=A0ABT7CX52_9BACT|nr:HAMP domain-containing sensor histidine kinase [Xanthocytophaga flavus]MDJ1497512.1 HAMP domain-containing sensor histidine kinase [Xanthocytophaga flavus]